MTGEHRLARGGRVDRARPLRFTFDGHAYEGCQGDTLASALLANGVHLVGRSFKYHRPRGFLAAGAEEPNALCTVARDRARTEPNLRMTQVELYEGLVASSQNSWPARGFDLGAVNDLLSPLLGAGFYYKTFMGPRFVKGTTLWAKLFEPVIRRAAGLGVPPKEADPDHYANRFAHCDVLVVGGGAAGLAAALAAARAGARTILCDEGAEMGGALLCEPDATVDGMPAAAWVAATLAELARRGATLLPRTQGFGYYNHNFVALAQRLTDHLPHVPAGAPRERLWQVRAKRVVLATGAAERPLVFPDNDRPGVMLADAARAYLQRYGVKPGTQALVVTAHDAAYRTALALARAGVKIARIVDTRPRPAGPGLEAARAAGLPVTVGGTVVGTTGSLRVSGAMVAQASGTGATDFETVPCDLLLMSGGFTPAVHLFSQSRGKLRFDAETQRYLPGDPAQAQASVGACAGSWGLAAALDEGSAAGAAAAGSGAGRSHAVTGDHAGEGGGILGALPHGRDPARVKAFVDFQNDVTAKDIKLAVREGFRSIEHVKRYTTTGMATDQGKTSNMNSLAIAAGALGRTLPEVGLTTFRQPYTPVTFGTFAGAARDDLFDPVRRTPIHDLAAAQGARFEDVGQWKRAWYFPEAGEDLHAAVAREVRATRAVAGIFDASTLGKIEVVGPDAAEFLNRLYTNAWTKLAPGRCRYGLMLDEPGFVMDDGVVGRLGPDRFHVTTTTGGAPRVLNHMEDYLQTEFPELKVWLTSVTEQWAVIAVQGPRARDIVAPLVEGIDLSAQAFPHMAIREGRICGVPTRLFRVSFTGELGFEVNVPADYAAAVWQALWERTAALGGTAYGTEAMHVMRAEKGYVIVGQETDGTTTPDDLGLGGMVAMSKPDFVGKRSLARPDLVAPGRKQLVGLAIEGRTVLEEGAQITPTADPPVGTHAIGHVTSAYWSPTAGTPIALALVENGRARTGETVFVPMPGGAIAARVVGPVFHDPEGKRLNG
ncbi:sarcosine oxidase subunit alpha family protein [Lichenibacterium ramalinae]|uniref:Sarcosine oxidase subunit alpha family protein n=1 Tax=Lichenibacterium ramalinae TaxID=2316527 RepID=A0A4V1RIQ0_9HYPH|nr:sarcosine oxidase subunit alpha family protein [Lichenibacterium ramalinae]RYB05003.1 sarcosine oxidase subunit alpha family protein [Lichenibacterium ramalinae]